MYFDLIKQTGNLTGRLAENGYSLFNNSNLFWKTEKCTYNNNWFWL